MVLEAQYLIQGGTQSETLGMGVYVRFTLGTPEAIGGGGSYDGDGKNDYIVIKTWSVLE